MKTIFCDDFDKDLTIVMGILRRRTIEEVIELLKILKERLAPGTAGIKLSIIGIPNNTRVFYVLFDISKVFEKVWYSGNKLHKFKLSISHFFLSIKFEINVY